MVAVVIYRIRIRITKRLFSIKFRIIKFYKVIFLSSPQVIIVIPHFEKGENFKFSPSTVCQMFTARGISNAWVFHLLLVDPAEYDIYHRTPDLSVVSCNTVTSYTT